MPSNYLTKNLRRSALAVALGLCFAGGVQAQSTTGGIYGTAQAGATVTVTNHSGLTRTVTAGADGKYSINNLPIGDYTVSTGSAQRETLVAVGRSVNVSFTGNDAVSLEAMTVTASGIPTIDVTSTSTRTILTAEQLQRLPIPRSAESIALLAPGAVSGNGTFFGGQVSFGGSSVAENAYYLNGYFSGNPMTNVGGFSLPYGSIAQQETYTGGYGAKYGRSSGGVISQVGKSGTNEWHFGGQIVLTPRGTREVRPNRFFTDAQLPADYSYIDPTLVGLNYDQGKDRKSWSQVYSIYAGGPIIKDKLFFFVSGEYTNGKSVSPPASPEVSPSQIGAKFQSKEKKIYAKINWNINDNNLLEATYVNDFYKSEGKDYNFDWASYKFGDYIQNETPSHDNTEFTILRYTGYLTDSLTLSAIWGHSRNHYETSPLLTGDPVVDNAYLQNPSIADPSRDNNQIDFGALKTSDYTDGLRVELEWVVGDHALTLGMDNTKLEGANEGQSQITDRWIYSHASSENSNIAAALGVGSTGLVPGSCDGTPLADRADGGSSNCGYYVYQYKFFDNTSMHNKQQAYYLQDKWQVTDNFLLSLGVRADTYKNFNDQNVQFVDSGTQWQPRIGFSWDVNGDSTFKIFGNAGRYFLNMPNAVAIRGVGASTYTREYFTYTGVGANGVPTGLTPVSRLGSPGTPAGAVSSNGEVGTPKDPLSYVPSDIKSQYQDEFVLGFAHSIGPDWSYGAKFTKRELKSSIDDFCDPTTLIAAAGLNVADFDYHNSRYIAEDSSGQLYGVSYCFMFNPGGSNTYALPAVTDEGGGIFTNTGDYFKTKVASSALGMPPLERSYKAIDLYLEHPWDGKWSLRVDYTYSKSQGNSEGPANSDTGQGNNPHGNGVSTSQNWDAWQIMAFANGYLPNDRRHQLKIHGAYAITPEWLVSANVRIQSGAPFSCFGYYDPDGSIDHTSSEADPIGYYSSYHTCFGEAWKPGKTTTPWTHRYDVGVTYSPAALDHKLALRLNVYNLFNERKPTSYSQTSEVAGAPYLISNTYQMPIGFTTPRYMQLSVSYDF